MRAATIILSTYNQGVLLEHTLWGYMRQSTLDFECIIADDGSGEETRERVKRLSRTFPVPLLHVWQPDTGFHKARAVNRAALHATTRYLIFSDGDCIPRRTFVEEHLVASQPTHYVVGGFVRLTEAQTTSLTCERVARGEFEHWISPRQQLALTATHLKSCCYIATGKRRKPKFYGLNFSVDRDSFFEVNGFDDHYRDAGREDSDLRNRMQLAGLRATSLWHRAGVFHQYHLPHPGRRPGAYLTEYYNRADLCVRAPSGLMELDEETRKALGEPCSSPLGPLSTA